MSFEEENFDRHRVRPIELQLADCADDDQPSKYANTVVCTNAAQFLDTIGFFNRYTLFIVIALSATWSVSVMAIVAPAFIANGPSCVENEIECMEMAKKFITIKQWFQLSNSSAANPDWINSLFFAGNAVGGLILSTWWIPKKDRELFFYCFKVGRQVIVACSLFLFGIFGILCSFSPVYWLFLVLRFLQGSFFTGATMVSFVLVAESLSDRHHVRATILFGVFWVIGYVAVAPIAYLLPHWSDLLLAISIPSCLYGIFLWFAVPESFKFLVLKRDQHNVNKWMMRTQANSSKQIEYDLNSIFAVNQTLRTAADGGQTPVQRLCFYTCIFSFLWMTDFLIYNSLSYFSTDIHSNPYFSYVLSGLFELPAYSSLFLMDKFGRKKIIMATHLITAIFLCLLFFIERGQFLYLCFWMCSKLATTASFTCLLVFTSEVFPTRVRNTCVGICTFTSNFGAIFAPHAKILEVFHPGMTFLTFGVLSALDSALILFIPETCKNA